MMLLFASITWILIKSPLISDDFEFANLGYATINQALPYVLFYGNGRLLGNIAGVVLINYPVLSAMIKAAVICGIIWMLPMALGIQKEPRYMVISALLLTLMNPDIFGQVFTWTSAFMNFVPPILFMLICMALIRNARIVSSKRMLLLGVLGIAGQLFVEHSTMLHILIASVTVVESHLKKDPVRKQYALCWLAASIAGALLMFLIPHIFYLEDNRTTGYRKFHVPDLMSYALKSVFLIINTLSKSTCLIAGISLVMLVLTKKQGVTLQTVCYLVYPFISVFFQFVIGETGIIRLARYFFLYGGLILYLSLFIYDIWKHTNKSVFLEVLLFMGYAVTSVAPFLIVSPFGERCIFVSYVLLSMMLIRIIHHVYSLGNGQWFKRTIYSGIILLIGGILFLNFEFSRIDAYNTKRDTYITEQIAAGKSEITIFDIPSRYTFGTYLPELYYYREKQHDTKFTIVEYKVWEALAEND